MKSLLTICIPTYKRPITLKRCIDSIVEQIEKFSLFEKVNIYVADDASSDGTGDVLKPYKKLSYFDSVSREQNLGMNQNIKLMLSDTAQKSIYQLIITDDDYLQPDILDEIVDFINQQLEAPLPPPVIWTPRYSYTENGDLHCVVCNPFNKSKVIHPSAINAGRYMHNGFVLSGLILRADHIDYKFWDQYKRNAYFPMIFVGDLLFRYGGYYWDKNIVHHTVLNQCNWERWGKNDIVISLRLLSDYLETNGILAKKIREISSSTLFNFFALKNTYNAINSLLASKKTRGNKKELFEAIDELKKAGFLNFNTQRKLVITFLLSYISSTSFIKLAVYIFSFIFSTREDKKKKYKQKKLVYSENLKFIPITMKIFFR
ncbi:MAG: glycosyltransferase family 2 protein [Desulfobacterales bacterium]|nr:glycosyltransferase family 2 protein [Desulfobacterales bacterium]